MPILYRYILRETGGVFLATCLILLAVIVSFRLSALLGRAASGNMELGAVWQLIALQSVDFLATIAPLAFVLAGVMTLGRLYNDHEISALYAGGIGRGHLCRAFLRLAVPIAAALLCITLYALPGIYSRQDIIRHKAQQEAGMLLFGANIFRQLDYGIVVHTESYEQGALQGFFLAQSANGSESAIFAASGALSGGDARVLTLQNGRRIAWQQSADGILAPEYSTFQSAELQLPHSTEQAGGRLRNIPTALLDRSAEHLGEWQSRLNPALALIVFTLALPFFTRHKPRQGRFQNILPAFLLFALYINALEFSTLAVKKGRIPALPGSLWVHCAALFLIVLLWMKPQKAAR